MAHNSIVKTDPEKAFLVGVSVKGSRPLLSTSDSLNELALLTRTAGIDIVGQATQQVHHIEPATFIGSGKVDEIRQKIEDCGAQIIIFDDELSPRHQRQLEERFGENVKLLDRSALILDIFAQHARTREGALQVELAQYEYRLPRLTRQWTHLARQAGGGSARGGIGGVGLRGPGETQLEVDRREIRRRITKLKEELERVRGHRTRHRQQRTRAGVPVVALVGYTNAGKSTLLNAITGADVYVADQLFATLDPTTRRMDLPSGREVLLSDTVGFIQKLPTTLIAAFRATLEEITEADLLIHVVDVNHPNVLQQIETVEDTLAEIDVPAIPRLLAWNKMDLWSGETLPTLSDSHTYLEQIRVSAAAKTGIADLLKAIEQGLAVTSYHSTLLIPHTQGDLLAYLYEHSQVENRVDREDGVLLTLQLPSTLYRRFREYQVEE
ncbi:MAG: GTPase HflX [Chloroflexi bacterium]|nr:GTPase HflX [Chloroflexota bacterium]